MRTVTTAPALQLQQFGPALPPCFNSVQNCVVSVGTGLQAGSVVAMYSRADNNGLILATVDVASGDYTLYTVLGSGYYLQLSPSPGVIPLGGNHFLVTCGIYGSGATTTFFVSAPNVRLNNPIPMIVTAQPVPITCSCRPGNSPNSVFYDPSQNLVAGEFIAPTGQDGGQIYNSIYKLNGYNLTKIAEGLTGDYPPDPFNLSNGSIPGAVSNANYWLQLSNGLQLSKYYDKNNQAFLGSFGNKIIAGANSGCTVPGVGPYTGASVQTASVAEQYLYNNAYDEYNAYFDSDLPGVVGAYNQYLQTLQLIDAADDILLIPGIVGYNNYKFAVSSSFIVAFNPNGQGGTQQMWRAFVDTPSKFGPANPVKISQQLRNFARPVSIFGGFKS